MSKISKIKPYLKAQYLVPLTALFFVFLYAFYQVTGSGEAAVRQRRNSISRDGSGYFYFYKLFKDLDYRFKRWYKEELPEVEKDMKCMVYFDYRQGDEEKIKPLLEWANKGNVLFIVGVHTGFDPVLSRRIVTGRPKKITVSRRVTTAPLRLSFYHGRHLKAGAKDDVLINSDIGALLLRHPMNMGEVYIFPENRWFVNGYFSHPDHAVLLNGVFKQYFNRQIYIYEHESSSGKYRVNNPVMVVFKGSFGWFTFHLFLLGLVFASWKGRRFGSPLHLAPFRRRSLGVHLEAVGNFYQKTGATQIVDGFMRRYLIYRLKHLLNIKKKLTDDQLIEAVTHYMTHPGNQKERLQNLLAPPRHIPEKSLYQKRKDINRLLDDILNQKKESGRS